MLDLVLQYSSTFALHALIGGAAVLVGAWLLYRLGRAFGWHTRGERGPPWMAALMRFGGVIMLVIATTATALQVGTIQALAKALESGAQELVLSAALEAGKPLGIDHPDQRLSLTDAERLIAGWAPTLLAQGRAAVTAHPWWSRAGDVWQGMPMLLQTWIANQGPRSETTPRELVRYLWRNAAAPTVEAARWQALIFAYGIAFLMIATVALAEWLWLGWTRRAA
ncbi:MAG TPA: hypothetical protein VN581_11455 [Patescibacteria group bacterium]|nr:hypothetical protein [Patescibacteria group bacterium]